jgi:hypothetical protein
VLLPWPRQASSRTWTAAVGSARAPLVGLQQNGTSAMITFLGAFIFVTVVMIGALDRISGLGVLQKYESPWHAGPRRDPSRPARRRRRARGT